MSVVAFSMTRNWLAARDSTSIALGRGKVTRQASFISRRRRHTRSLRDWSSDVCSSDLSVDDYATLTELRPLIAPWMRGVDDASLRLIRTAEYRSEERRVGKECRCRWWPFQ